MFHYTEFANNLFLCRLTKVKKLICYLKKDQVTENCNPCWTLSCELCTTKFTRRPNLNTQMKALHDIIIKAYMYWQKHFLLPCQITDHFESCWRSVRERLERDLTLYYTFNIWMQSLPKDIFFIVLLYSTL